MAEKNIESLLQEQRVFPPSPEFSKLAHIQSLEVCESIWTRALEDPEGFGPILPRPGWLENENVGFSDHPSSRG